MLETIGVAPGRSSEVDWYETWRSSAEYQTIQDESSRHKTLGMEKPRTGEKNDPASYREFAAPLCEQFMLVTQRVFQQSWRTPSYVYSKLSLCIASSLFVALVFLDAPLSI